MGEFRQWIESKESGEKWWMVEHRRAFDGQAFFSAFVQADSPHDALVKLLDGELSKKFGNEVIRSYKERASAPGLPYDEWMDERGMNFRVVNDRFSILPISGPAKPLKEALTELISEHGELGIVALAHHISRTMRFDKPGKSKVFSFFRALMKGYRIARRHNSGGEFLAIRDLLQRAGDERKSVVDVIKVNSLPTLDDAMANVDFVVPRENIRDGRLDGARGEWLWTTKERTDMDSPSSFYLTLLVTDFRNMEEAKDVIATTMANAMEAGEGMINDLVRFIRRMTGERDRQMIR